MHVPVGTSLWLRFYFTQLMFLKTWNMLYDMWNGFTQIHTQSRSSSLLVYSWLYLPSGSAVLGESSWSEGDSEVLEPGEEDMELWRFTSVKFFWSKEPIVWFLLLAFWPCIRVICVFVNRKRFTPKTRRSTWWSQATSWWCKTSSTSRGSSGSTWSWTRPRHWRAAPGITLTWFLCHDGKPDFCS